nr:MAG TPA: hypothetical protein [Caudoviricetes sp.]
MWELPEGTIGGKRNGIEVLRTAMEKQGAAGNSRATEKLSSDMSGQGNGTICNAPS